MHYSRLKDVKKELNQLVSELPYVQYSKKMLMTVVFAAPHMVCALWEGTRSLQCRYDPAEGSIGAARVRGLSVWSTGE